MMPITCASAPCWCAITGSSVFARAMKQSCVPRIVLTSCDSVDMQIIILVQEAIFSTLSFMKLRPHALIAASSALNAIVGLRSRAAVM
jgi:hypothetical protein